tara:strand:- start:226 stop:660 length:435 start_codon:yes stop_codon:yes gene_type:complete
MGDYSDIILENNKYTILSKSNCIFCDKSKELLNSLNIDYYDYINCDKYLTTQRNTNNFLEHICSVIGYEYMLFPMIFYNKKFIGGYSELVIHVDKNNKKESTTIKLINEFNNAVNIEKKYELSEITNIINDIWKKINTYDIKDK